MIDLQREHLNVTQGGNRLRGIPKARWEDKVTEDAGIIGVKMWTAKAKSKDDWNRILRKTRTLNGLLRQC